VRKRKRHAGIRVYLRPVEIPGMLNEKPAKKNGKLNYNAAARAWHGTVAIMRFMAAENVVAITSDNGAVRTAIIVVVVIFFLLSAPSAKGQQDDFDSTEDNCRNYVHRLESRLCGAFKSTIISRK